MSGYAANVTAFTAELHSDTVVTELKVPGEYYDLDILLSKVVVFNTTLYRFTFTIRAKEITATSVVTVPLTDDVSEVFDMKIDQSNFPHWLRDPSDDDSCDSDCSLVSTSALYHPKNWNERTATRNGETS